MMINNSVAIQTAHITTQANMIADRISRITNESLVAHDFPLIQQDFPELNKCGRFHPSASLISHIMDAISQKSFIDPMEVNSKLLNDPGQIIS